MEHCVEGKLGVECGASLVITYEGTKRQLSRFNAIFDRNKKEKSLTNYNNNIKQ